MFEYQIIVLLIFSIVIFYIAIRLQNQVKEFKINSYLKLKLESGKSNIYVKNRLFRQCMYLLINIPVNKIEEYDEIDSIDEAAEKLDRSMENDHNIITPEEEFIGHCSNLQAWAENGYDTRILHRSLSFPLLKRLTEVGDPLAKKVFKEEIALRFASKHLSVTRYLTQNGYLKYLNSEEFEIILDNLNPNILEDQINNVRRFLEPAPQTNLKPSIFYLANELLRNFGIEHISLIISKILKELSENLRKNLVIEIYNLFKTRKKFPLIQFINQQLKYFEGFEFGFDFIKYKDNIIGVFKDNKIYLRNQNISDINDIEGLEKKIKKIEILDLSDNQINSMKGFDKFVNLKCLKLNNNRITDIKSLENLKNLQELYLRNNKISEIKEINNFASLKHLDLSGNTNITEIPECLNNFLALKTLKLWNCSIEKFSDSISKFFWNDQNYRYYKGYTQNDKDYYEKTYNKMASSDNGLYKHFVLWVIKMRNMMVKQKFTYQDIEIFERNTLKKAIWSGRSTNAFIKWLEDKTQLKITDFF